MKKILISFFAVFAFFTLSQASFAVTNIGTVSLSKSVLNPKTNTYVHSLGLTDPMYHPGETITFHITVGNHGTDPVSSLTIKDTFPPYVTFTAGSGNFDEKTHTLSFSVTNLKPRTTQSFAISGKIVDPSQLPTDQGVVCAGNIVDGPTAGLHDTSSFCIQKTFAPTTAATTPATGPEIIPLTGLILSGLAGFFVRKSAKKKMEI